MLSDATSELKADLVDIQGGVLSGVGTVTGDLDNAGVVSPGTTPGIITVTGSFNNIGELLVEIFGRGSSAGGAPGIDFDQIDVLGDITSGGTLTISVDPGSMPVLGDLYGIIPSAASQSGVFSIVNGTDIGGGLFIRPIYRSNGVDLQVTDVGDANLEISSINGPDVVDAGSAIRSTRTFCAFVNCITEK